MKTTTTAKLSTKAFNVSLRLAEFGTVQVLDVNRSACLELVAAGRAVSEVLDGVSIIRQVSK